MNKNKVLFILQSSKTHNQSMPPQIIKISSQNLSDSNSKRTSIDSGVTSYCPFALLCDYLAYREDYADVSENFFIFRGGILVQPLNFRKTLKQMIYLAGLDQSYYSTHSLRAGRSCDLLKLGFSVETIKKLGRWHSNSVYAYLKNI